ncbi:MAG: MMPL family transporter [Gammaproteobacteria bacterium]|nr:MMPL family transporter [Gammaproteobacteria bacterium]MXW45955.1 MMPL family transporter [Gammaproteobacteria bacterium]MYD02482.1 MMPL family transporter [Gammaproteobacteria bacterium]MYI25968.1 MMPL family transporter [Gammaproteobacteria bacterium]
MSGQDTSKGQFETRFAEWVVAFRWRVILAALFLVAAASSGILRLNFSGDYRIFFDEDNPQLLALEALEDTYGKNENVVFLIVPDDGNATSEAALSAAAWLTEAAWQTPYSRRVDSLTNFQYTTADGDDLYVRDLVDPEQLGDSEARSRIRALALADPRVEGSILAAGGDVSVVNVTVELPYGDQLEAVAEVAGFAREIAAQAEEQFAGVDLRVVGTVMINQTFLEASIESQMIFLPASLALMALILGVLIRGIAGVAATGTVIVFSILASIGLGGWAGLPFSPPISPAPTIVLMIVVANCVHLLVTLQQRMRAGHSKRDAIVHSVSFNLHPVFLASLTTALGFLSMNFSEVPPYRHLGNFVAFGIGMSFLLSVTFLPAMLSLLPVRPGSARRLVGPLLGAMADFALRRRKALLWGWVVVVIAMIVAIPRNELNDVLVHFFDESVEFRRDTDFMDERLSGNTVLDYSLAAADAGGVTDPEFLAEVSAFAEWFREQPSVRHVSVITDTFRQLNQSMHGDDPAYYRIPESRELAAQYLLLYELSLPQGLDLNNQIDTLRSATRMTVSSTTLYSQDLLDLNARADAWLKENAPRIVGVNSSGPSALFAYIGQRNIRAMLLGTIVVLVAISAILLAALRSLRLGLVSIVPNLLPAVMGFGVWGLMVGQVGLSLSVVVAMTIGIVVDDTVHFLAKYRRARRDYGRDPEQAVHYAFETAGRALFTTTVVLVAGFLIFAFSPFLPTAQVGILTAMVIGFALIADLSLLPALLLAIDKPSGGQIAHKSALVP